MVEKELKIHFKGPDQVVREGNTAVWKALSKLKEHEIELPKSIVSILASNAGNVFISSQFKRNQIDAVVSFEASDNTKVLITAADREDTKKAMQLIEKATAEEYVHLEQDQTPLTQSEMWEMLMNSFQTSMLLKVTTELASNTLWIGGIKDEVDKAKAQIVMFFEKNSIINKFVETSAGRKKVLLRYEIVAIKNIEERLKDQSVKITLDDNEEGISIRGTREGTQKAVQKVQNLVDKVKERSIDLDKPGMKKLFSEKKGVYLLGNVEHAHNCIIERCTPAQDKKGSIVVATEAGENLSKQICSYVTPEGKQIILFKGDLTEHKVDVMVNAANQRLQHVGGLAKAIVQKGGQEIQTECDDFVVRNGILLDGDVVATCPGKLPCKRLVHAVGPEWPHNRSWTRYGDSETKKELILGQTVSNVLGEAKGFTSIALPAISAGVFGFPADICAKTIVDSVLEYSEENAHSKLSEIHIVDMNDDVIKAFTKEMTSRFSNKDAPTIQAFENAQKNREKPKERKFKERKLKKGKRSGGSPPTSHRSLSSEAAMYQMLGGDGGVAYSVHGKMWLTVFASSDKQLDKAECAIKELISENSKKKSIDIPAIRELSQAQEDRIARLEAKHSTEIVVEKRIGRIVISGVSDDVSEAVMEVYEILKEQAEEKNIRRFAELVSKTVQWYYMEDGDEAEPYDNEINVKIEQAFMDNKTSINLNFAVDEYGKQQPYNIDFGSMTETNLATRNVARVVRNGKELVKGIPLPSHWEPQPKDIKGKERDVHLVLLHPVKHKTEYDVINNAITKTTAINIVKIERVQNPELYRAYMLKNQKMDDRNGSNEKKLFHGTPVNTCMSINHKGFNKSYCGKNATAFGKGVYFARDASYYMRSTYSPPDTTGKRCMYLASVLVGDYAEGETNMIVPPQKDPTNPTITYDSTVDNVAHDNQVYPDYLITFK